jgi:hypothetical protein
MADERGLVNHVVGAVSDAAQISIHATAAAVDLAAATTAAQLAGYAGAASTVSSTLGAGPESTGGAVARHLGAIAQEYGHAAHALVIKAEDHASEALQALTGGAT